MLEYNSWIMWSPWNLDMTLSWIWFKRQTSWSIIFCKTWWPISSHATKLIYKAASHDENMACFQLWDGYEIVGWTTISLWLNKLTSLKLETNETPAAF
jgi:hypothetical protein